MADFNYYLNRVGVRGPKGEQGEQGFSPIITVATDTLSEYILQIQTQNNTFQTANLREHKDDLGGTYIRYNRETGVMYAGEADTATTQNLGEVRFATATELERNDGSTVVTPADVNTLIDNRDYDAELTRLAGSIQTNSERINANALLIGSNTLDIRTLRENVGDINARVSTVEGNYVTTNTAQTITGNKTFDLLRTDRVQTSGGATYLRTSETVTGTDLTIGNSSVFGDIEISTPGEILLSSPNIKTYRNGSLYDNLDTGNISNYVPDMNNYYNTTQIDLMLNEKADVSDIPAVGNGTITFTQGGVTKGTITTNQSGDTTIALDAGGGASYTEGPGINIDNDEISVDDTVVALKSDIPDVSNMVTTNTTQTVTGPKTFNSGSGLAVGYIKSLTGYGLLGRDAASNASWLGNWSYDTELRGTNINVKRNGLNGATYTNLDSGNIGDYALTSSNISTNAYIQALEARIAALEANINGGNAASA